MEQVIEVLVSFWLFDVAVFSSVWLYIPFMIPFTFYLVFFMIKWVVLTLPVWMPFMMLIRAWKNPDDE